MRPKRTSKKAAPKIVINGNDIKVKKLGRPSSYNQKIADDIMTLVNNGMSIDAISRLPQFPSRFCISNWLVTKPDFYESYMRAKRSQALLLAEQCIEGTQDRSNDASGELGIPNGVARYRRDRLISSMPGALVNLSKLSAEDLRGEDQYTRSKVLISLSN